MELDSGETVTVRAGDVVIQRGTNHVWHNRSEAPCRFAWILIDAVPVVVNGHRLSERHEPDVILEMPRHHVQLTGPGSCGSWNC